MFASPAIGRYLSGLAECAVGPGRKVQVQDQNQSSTLHGGEGRGKAPQVWSLEKVETATQHNMPSPRDCSSVLFSAAAAAATCRRRPTLATTSTFIQSGISTVMALVAVDTYYLHILLR